jgi:hypothetical protein
MTISSQLTANRRYSLRSAALPAVRARSIHKSACSRNSCGVNTIHSKLRNNRSRSKHGNRLSAAATNLLVRDVWSAVQEKRQCRLSIVARSRLHRRLASIRRKQEAPRGHASEEHSNYCQYHRPVSARGRLISFHLRVQEFPIAAVHFWSSNKNSRNRGAFRRGPHRSVAS